MQKEGTTVVISLGANTCPDQHLDTAVELTDKILTTIYHTKRIWTVPIAICSQEMFRNMLVFGRTTLPLDTLKKHLQEIEKTCGRVPSDKANGIVKMDADILLYGDQKLHVNDWERPYVKELMKELKTEINQ